MSKFHDLVAAKKQLVQEQYDAKIAQIDSEAAQLKLDAEELKNKNLASIQEVEIAVEEYGKEREDIGYDKGQADAGVPADDKKYTEADLQAELALKEQAVKDSFIPQINDLNSQIAALSQQVADLSASVAQQIENAVEAFKAEMLVAAQEQQSSENQTEMAFLDKLQPKPKA